MKIKRKQIAMLIFIAIIIALMVVTGKTPGEIADPENYQCKTYATILSLLPPVIAIGLALITKEVYTSLLAGIITGDCYIRISIWSWASIPCCLMKMAV